MSEPAEENTTSSSATPMTARHRRPAAMAATERVSLQLRVAPESARRLLRALARGHDEFTLSAVDGSLTVRVRAELHVGGTRLDTATDARGGGAPVTINWATGALRNAEACTILSRTELRLLGALVEHAGRPIGRKALARQVWPATGQRIQNPLNAVAVYVCTLRKRLRGIGLGEAIETIRGQGYRLRGSMLAGLGASTPPEEP